MILTQRYYYIFSYATRLLDDYAQTDWTTAQAVEIVLKWLVFYNVKTV